MAKLDELATFPCFSANLSVSGQPWATPYTVTTISGVRVGITGVSQPELADFSLPEGVSFTDPAAALDKALKQLRRKADLQVVCLEGEPLLQRSCLLHLHGDCYQ